MKTNNIKAATKSAISALAIVFSLISANGEALAQSKNEVPIVEALAPSKNEVSFYLQGSFSKLAYEALEFDSEMENGFGLGANYAYYLTENWSFGTGVEVQYMEGSIFIPTIQGSFLTQDVEADEFEFRYRAINFAENQEVYMLNIPLQVQYESSGTVRFYAAAGVKAGLVLNSEYQSSATSLETSGFYPQYDVELTSPEFAGFGEFAAINNAESELDLKTNIVGHVESGIKLMLENSQSLYMGLFLDYGLNDIKPDASSERLVDYKAQNPTDFVFGSLLSSRRDNNVLQDLDDVRTLAFGLKIKYAFQF